MKHFLFLSILLSTSIFGFSQAKPTSKVDKIPTYYFYTIYYGFNYDVYVSEVYALEMERDELYANTTLRYNNGMNYILEQNIAPAIQSGFEKNYHHKEQAETERLYMLGQLATQYKVTSFRFSTP